MPHANAEHKRAYNKAWREANPERFRAAVKRWVDKHPGCMAGYTKSYRERHYSRTVIKRLRESAVKKGVPMELTEADVDRLLSTTVVCPVFGTPFTVGGVRHDDSPSFDCFIPALGYVLGNVHVISWRANRLKNNATLEDVERLLAWMNSVQSQPGATDEHRRRKTGVACDTSIGA